MRARRKKWVGPYLDEHPELSGEAFNPADFTAKSPLFLEIGIGKGDFIVSQSAKIEGTYIGLERDDMVLSIAHKKVLSAERDNVFVYVCDFDYLYEKLSSLRFDVIYLNFSDPWPKKRHEKRRLTFAPRLANIASLLKEEGEIRIKTDNDQLYEFTLEQVATLPLKIVSQTTDYALDEVNDSQSEYEFNFRSKGKNINRIVLRKA